MSNSIEFCQPQILRKNLRATPGPWSLEKAMWDEGQLTRQAMPRVLCTVQQVGIWKNGEHPCLMVKTSGESFDKWWAVWNIDGITSFIIDSAFIRVYDKDISYPLWIPLVIINRSSLTRMSHHVSSSTVVNHGFIPHGSKYLRKS